jgi:hypothetical protein
MSRVGKRSKSGGITDRLSDCQTVRLSDCLRLSVSQTVRLMTQAQPTRLWMVLALVGQSVCQSVCQSVGAGSAVAGVSNAESKVQNRSTG